MVPDNAITASGRMVQCGSCGNKWRQFPIGEVKKIQSISRPKKDVSKPLPIQQKKQKTKKLKRLFQKNQEKSVCTRPNIWQKSMVSR